jgi:predicted Zn-ribbon and HTH transcriptional regulator
MTYAELQARMSNAEFELWMALAHVRSHECPNCGHEAKEMMNFQLKHAKCPICKYEYHRTTGVDAWPSSDRQTH